MGAERNGHDKRLQNYYRLARFCPRHGYGCDSRQGGGDEGQKSTPKIVGSWRLVSIATVRPNG